MLKSFPVGLLGSLWPASRWVVGIKVNSWVRKELLENATALLRCTGYRRQDKGKVDAERIGNDLVLAKGNVHLEMQAGSSGRYAGLVAGNRGLPCSELLCGLEQGLDGGLRNNLTRLALTNSNLVIELAEGLSHLLRACRALTHLSLNDNALGDHGIELMSNSLWGCRQLEHLDLSGNFMQDEGAKTLADGLAGPVFTCAKLKTLKLCGMEIRDAGAIDLLRAASRIGSLQELDLDCNRIEGAIRPAFSQALSKCTALTSLSLNCNKLGTPGLQALADGAIAAGALRCLFLGRHVITADGAAQLERVLAGCPVRELSLHVCWIGDEQLCVLAAALRMCPTLTALNLAKNNISILGAAALAAALTEPRPLPLAIDLAGNAQDQREGSEPLEMLQELAAGREKLSIRVGPHPVLGGLGDLGDWGHLRQAHLY